MVKSPTGKIAGALAAFEDTIRQNNAAAGTTPASETTTTTTTTTASSPSHVVIPTKPRPRVPWKDSNLALVNSDLHHKITQAAAGLETAWKGIGDAAGTNVWRIEQFHVVAWPTDRYGDFYTGDSYIVLHAYRRGVSDALFFDVHIWIGQESSQDEYGTAAYKMVECDDFLGGRAVQHREVQGHESPKFQSYFDNELTYLEGGVDTGFSHVEAKTFTANLYQIKGTEKGLSMTQRPLTKSSLNGGDSFILFCDPSKVWVWHGSQANPDEKAKANVVSEKMCTQGTTVTIQQEDGEEEYPDFWTTLGGTDGEVAPPQDGDELVKEFTPVLFRITGGGNVVKIAEADKIRRFGSVALKLDRAFLDDDDVFLLDAGWEVFLWVGNGSDKEEKVAGLSKADEYLKKTVRTANLPLTIVKSGWESPDFWQFFKA